MLIAVADEKDVVVLDGGAPLETREARGAHDEPPVVARLVVEIRSDGTRTIARGALQDAVAGQEVAIKAEGTTPLSLALALARSMLKTPSLSRAFSGALRSLKPRKPDDGRG